MLAPRLLWGAILLVGAALPAAAATYTVGPAGRDFTQLHQVAPILGPGDLVLVDGGFTYQPVLFTHDGTAAEPIVVRGVRSAAGARPVVSGGTNTIEIQSDHFVLEGFEVTAGSFRCIYHHADEVTVRDVYVHSCPAHGILSADEDSGSLTLEHCEVAYSGNGSTQHSIYVTSDQNAHPGSVFRMRHCYVHDGTGGNLVKSRAERNEIHYNWFEGSRYHILELIGPDEDAVTPPAGIREDSDVVGNVLIHKAYDPPGPQGPFEGNFYFVRAGSDIRCDDGGWNSTRGRYRFAHNTFVRTTTANGSHLFRPFGYLQTLEMHGNVFWSSATGAMGLVRADAGEACWTDGVQILGSHNWVETGTSSIPSGWSNTYSGASPGFEDAAALDFRPAVASPLLDRLAVAPPTFPPDLDFPDGHWPPLHEPARAALPGAPAWPPGAAVRRRFRERLALPLERGRAGALSRPAQRGSPGGGSGAAGGAGSPSAAAGGAADAGGAAAGAVRSRTGAKAARASSASVSAGASVR